MRRSLAMVGTLLLCASAGLSAQAMRNVARISIDELKPLVEQGSVLVLDVRRPDEFVQGHIPGAVNLDYTLVAAQGSRFKAETRPIVAYCACANEMTAARAAVDLAGLGITGAKALKGGWNEWVARGERIEK
ncbi:MAG TPA: rhodanese-like domain-containing protein [Vicinamibacterales bacterium]|jgi:rhodanese-related sulfurtransferase|nr:rhodanese-like domain-containing protein [Vicinamibacterales bacterium]